jgi:hypothetical protein
VTLFREAFRHANKNDGALGQDDLVAARSDPPTARVLREGAYRVTGVVAVTGLTSTDVM